jgi:hypothetical protein
MFAGIRQDDDNSHASEEDENVAEEEDEEQTIFPDLSKKSYKILSTSMNKQ